MVKSLGLITQKNDKPATYSPSLTSNTMASGLLRPVTVSEVRKKQTQKERITTVTHNIDAEGVRRKVV